MNRKKKKEEAKPQPRIIQLVREACEILDKEKDKTHDQVIRRLKKKYHLKEFQVNQLLSELEAIQCERG